MNQNLMASLSSLEIQYGEKWQACEKNKNIGKKYIKDRAKAMVNGKKIVEGSNLNKIGGFSLDNKELINSFIKKELGLIEKILDEREKKEAAYSNIEKIYMKNDDDSMKKRQQIWQALLTPSPNKQKLVNSEYVETFLGYLFANKEFNKAYLDEYRKKFPDNASSARTGIGYKLSDLESITYEVTIKDTSEDTFPYSTKLRVPISGKNTIGDIREEYDTDQIVTIKNTSGQSIKCSQKVIKDGDIIAVFRGTKKKKGENDFGNLSIREKYQWVINFVKTYYDQNSLGGSISFISGGRKYNFSFSSSSDIEKNISFKVQELIASYLEKNETNPDSGQSGLVLGELGSQLNPYIKTQGQGQSTPYAEVWGERRSTGQSFSDILLSIGDDSSTGINVKNYTYGNHSNIELLHPKSYPLKASNSKERGGEASLFRYLNKEDFRRIYYEVANEKFFQETESPPQQTNEETEGIIKNLCDARMTNFLRITSPNTLTSDQGTPLFSPDNILFLINGYYFPASTILKKISDWISEISIEDSIFSIQGNYPDYPKKELYNYVGDALDKNSSISIKVTKGIGIKLKDLGL